MIRLENPKHGERDGHAGWGIKEAGERGTREREREREGRSGVGSIALARTTIRRTAELYAYYYSCTDLFAASGCMACLNP